MNIVDEQTVSVHRNSVGFVCASLGLAILTLTLVGVGWILVDPVPPEGVFALLALGGVPATIAMLLGLWRSFLTKKEFLTSASGPIHSPGIRLALIGLGLLLIGIAIFAVDCVRRQSQKRQWITQAQDAVVDVLHASDRIPADMRKRLGPFRSLTGERYGGPSWNIQVNRKGAVLHGG